MGISHKHLMVRAEVSEPITQEREAKDWLYEMVKIIKMELCPNGGPHAHYVNKPGNHGIAAVAMIETSHISLHVWDKLDPPLAQFDVYSCSDYNVNDVLDFIYKMKPTKVWWKLFDRGTILQEKDNSFKDHTKNESIVSNCEWYF